MKIFQTILLASILLAVVSCHKSEPIPVSSEIEVVDRDPTTSTQGQKIYYVDNTQVSEAAFPWNVTSNYYHINLGEKEVPNSENTYYYAFTTKTGYDEFQRAELGPIYDVHEAITQHLAEYAETSGAARIADETGSVPQWYLDYEAQYVQQALSAANSRSLSCTLFKHINCNSAFNQTIPLFGTPFFIFNNNEASALYPLFIGGQHRSYDRSFYRRKMFTINVWAFQCINIPEQFNDRTSSWWSIGL